MGPFVDLLSSVIKSYPAIFASPVFSGLYLLVLGLVAIQYSRIQAMEERMYGRAKNRAFNNTLIAIGLGLIGGLFASLLMVFLGVSVQDSGIQYLLPLALFLFLISPRFLCFSYAGGIISLSYLLFGWPRVNVPAITALVACLHASEALLIRISGHSCATPLYVQDKDDAVVGGFALQRFWPIPLIVMFLVKVPDISQLQGLISLPDWWPLIKAPEVAGTGTPVFTMMPVIAALGYGDLAVSRTPREKSKLTSRNLMLFSLILMAFSIAASRWPAFSWVAALFSPAGHEVVIKMGNKEEFESEPRYRDSDKGLMVLDVLPGSLAERAGIRGENILLSCNGVDIKSKEDFDVATRDSSEISITLQESVDKPKIRQVKILRTSDYEPVGIIPVPGLGERPLATPVTEGILMRFLKRILKIAS